VIHPDVKTAVENGDISSLKYFFCDSLDGDPTFSEYVEDYEYCKAKGILFVSHSELHPMNCNSVNEEYWVQLKKDFMQNPSVERMEHMREVAKILYSSRIRKIEEDNSRKTASKPTAKVSQSEPQAPSVSQSSPQPSIQANSSISKPSEPARTSDSIRRASEPISSDGIRRICEPNRTVPRSQGTQPKKARGVGRIVAFLIAVAVVVIVAICLINK
jgi:hypothetical protein